MSAKETESPPEILTLDPLYTDGPDALDTHDVPGLSDATLCEVEIRWKNSAFGVTIRKAEDLFADAAQLPLAPPATTITQATFELHFEDSPRPHRVTIRPPQNLILEFPDDRPRIAPWLSQRRFRRPPTALSTLAALLIALATAVAPALDDDDGDDDDAPTDRHTLRL